MRTNFRLEPRLTTQDKLRNLLINSGIWTTGELWRQRGAYTHAQWDLAKWGGQGTYMTEACEFYSWDTMTLCVKHGIELSVGRRYGGSIQIEISRKP